MRVGTVAAANQARLRGDEGQAPQVTNATGLGQSEGALVDALLAFLVATRRFVYSMFRSGGHA